MQRRAALLVPPVDVGGGTVNEQLRGAEVSAGGGRVQGAVPLLVAGGVPGSLVEEKPDCGLLSLSRGANESSSQRLLVA